MADKKRDPVPGMGAIPHEAGTTFRVWAPFAERVQVVGTFNEWGEGEEIHLEPEEDGYWAVDVAAAGPGDEYKYLLLRGEETLQRLDPYAREVTSSVGNAIVPDHAFDWGEAVDFQMAPWNELVIYEMHVGTFHDEPGGGPGTFFSAIEKLPYLRDLGINAVEIMPPMEFPGGISWGYNPALPFAIEQDYGGPQAFKEFVKAAHEHGIAVILDVVYNHFGPSDLDLWRFDGWYEGDGGGIYFYNDERAATPWGATRPDYGRGPVRRYLRDNALMWLEEYHVDGLRWDATAYVRDVNGNEGDPLGELPDGWSLMQWINEEIAARFPGRITIAEDLRQNEYLVKDTGGGGAGFGTQWDSDFVHTVRAAIIAQEDDGRDIEAVAAVMAYRPNGDAFKRVVYTESHDEVANGKARITEEIWPGNSLHWFAKKRSTLGAALVFAAAGIPMIFQGQEFLEDRWFHDQDPLDWRRAEVLGGFVRLYRDLIHMRRGGGGQTLGLTGQYIEVVHVNPLDKVLAVHRWREGGAGDSVVAVFNFANRTMTDYTMGFPAGGRWTLRFDSHATVYDEAYEGQVSGDVEAEDGPYDDMPFRGVVALAPYSAIFFSQ